MRLDCQNISEVGPP